MTSKLAFAGDDICLDAPLAASALPLSAASMALSMPPRPEVHIGDMRLAWVGEAWRPVVLKHTEFVLADRRIGDRLARDCYPEAGGLSV